jgi:hypothetical protein
MVMPAPQPSQASQKATVTLPEREELLRLHDAVRWKAARLKAAVTPRADDSAKQRLEDHLILCQAMLAQLDSALTAEVVPAELLDNAMALLSL